ncbi:MAG: YceI family protein [Nocardioidaceae bacterium]
MSEAPTADPGGDHSRVANHVLVPSPGVYTIDPVHTFVGFAAQHLVIGRVRGRFERLAGTVTIADDPTASALEVTVETASISTLFAARDDDLRSARFLDSDSHPTMTYRSTDVIERPRGEWNVLGDLCIRGVTQAVPLTVRFGGSITDSWGNPRASFHASGTVTRSAFGLVEELKKEAGSMLIGDDITLDIEAEAIRAP